MDGVALRLEMSPDEFNGCKLYRPASCRVSKTTPANIYRGLIGTFEKQDSGDFGDRAFPAMLENGRGIELIFNGPVLAHQFPSIGVMFQVSWNANARIKESLGPRFDISPFAYHHDVWCFVIQSRVQCQAFDLVVLGTDVVIAACRSDCQFGGRYP